MKTQRLFLLLCLSLFLFLGVSQPATAELVNINGFGGDRIVLDKTNDLYWYPLLSTMTGMTRADQHGYIKHVLNSGAYGGIKDWKFATLEQIMDMAYSMGDTDPAYVLEPYEMVPFGPGPRYGGPPNSKNVVGTLITDYFEETGYYDAAGNVDYSNHIICGRSANEVGANIEDLDGNNYLSGIPTEGEFHFPFNPLHPVAGVPTIVFDDDLNWVGDDLTYGDLPRGMPVPEGWTFVCSAWVVSETAPVPEPATMLLLGSGLVGLAGFKRKFRKK